MRDFTCDSVLDLYRFLREKLRDLPDEQLEFLTPAECDEFRAEVLEELRKDYAFKLLTLLEADLRDDFLESLKRRRRDLVSKTYRDLCLQFRRETRQVSKPAIQACRRVRLERIFDELRACFIGTDQAFREVCSVANLLDDHPVAGFAGAHAIHQKDREPPEGNKLEQPGLARCSCIP